MKKLMIMAVALLTAGIASAQVTYSLGYVKSDATVKVGNATTASHLNGFTISVDDNINLAGDLNVAPGVGMVMSFREKDNLKYTRFGLYVPVDFNYGFALGSDVKLFVYAGPTFDLGLTYKGKYNGNTWNMYDKDQGNLSRFDIQLGGGIWVVLKDQFRFQVGYKAGMLNLSKADGATCKNNVLSASIGYIF